MSRNTNFRSQFLIRREMLVLKTEALKQKTAPFFNVFKTVVNSLVRAENIFTGGNQ